MTDLLWRSDDGCAEVWLGDCLDPEQVSHVLGGRRAGALLVDAPYSERTHAGHAAGRLTAEQIARYGSRDMAAMSPERRYALRKGRLGKPRRDIAYPPWTRSDVVCFTGLWDRHVDGWMVSLTDDALSEHWSRAYAALGRVRFAALPFIETGSRVRMSGDGPSSWTCWVMVSRPKGVPWSKWGALRGAYVLAGERTFNSNTGSDRIIGGKPVLGMLLLVEDYSNRGDLIVDPCCGAGTTGVAARMMGRRFIGLDTCREHCEIAIRRLKNTREQVALPGIERAAVQVELPGVGDAP